MDETENIDLEVLALCLGVDRIAQLSCTSHEAIHSLLFSLHPENHRFFSFIRDCLISYIKKLGTKEAATRLGISSYVLDSILESSDSLQSSKTPSQKPEDENSLDSLKYTPEGRRIYTKTFKYKVVTEYLASRNLNSVCKKYGVHNAHVSN